MKEVKGPTFPQPDAGGGLHKFIGKHGKLRGRKVTKDTKQEKRFVAALPRQGVVPSTRAIAGGHRVSQKLSPHSEQTSQKLHALSPLPKSQNAPLEDLAKGVQKCSYEGFKEALTAADRALEEQPEAFLKEPAGMSAQFARFSGKLQHASLEFREVAEAHSKQIEEVQRQHEKLCEKLGKRIKVDPKSVVASSDRAIETIGKREDVASECREILEQRRMLRELATQPAKLTNAQKKGLNSDEYVKAFRQLADERIQYQLLTDYTYGPQPGDSFIEYLENHPGWMATALPDPETRDAVIKYLIQRENMYRDAFEEHTGS